jgi:hypothetical protein
LAESVTKATCLAGISEQHLDINFISLVDCIPSYHWSLVSLVCRICINISEIDLFSPYCYLPSLDLLPLFPHLSSLLFLMYNNFVSNPFSHTYQSKTLLSNPLLLIIHHDSCYVHHHVIIILPMTHIFDCSPFGSFVLLI